MNRIDRIAPLIDALSDDAFEDFVAAAAHATGSTTVYATLSDAERAKIDAATARLDAGEGVPYSESQGPARRQAQESWRMRITFDPRAADDLISQIDYLIDRDAPQAAAGALSPRARRKMSRG